MNEYHEESGWPQRFVISSRDRYTKKHGGIIWEITYVNFRENSICLESCITEECKKTEEWVGTGQEFQERFSKIE